MAHGTGRRLTAVPSPARVLVVAPRAPLPIRGGDDLRVLQHLGVLDRAGWDVHLLAVDPTTDRAANEQLATVHVATDPAVTLVQSTGDPDRLAWIADASNPFARVATPTVVRELREILDLVDPALVVLTGHEVSALLPHARHRDRPLVLDLHNVLAEIMRGGEELSAGHRARAFLHRRAIAAAEAVDATLLESADEVWCCGEVDAGIFRSHGSACPVVAIPNGVDVATYGPSDPTPTPTVVFTASFGYLPNTVAAHELLDAVDHLPDVELELVGAGVPADLHARVDATPRARATGPVADVRPHLRRAWVAAMPLRGGSGTRLKVAEAAASGVPIVATAKAVEGTPLEPGVHYRRAEAPAEVVAAIRELVDDAAERARLAAAALELAQDQLSWEAAGRVTESALRRLSGVAAP